MLSTQIPKDGAFKNMKIIMFKDWKFLRSKDLNYSFNMKNGYMEVYGKSKEDDPSWSPYGPFIADVEITTICNGIRGKLCQYCYKSNTCNGKNMSLATLQKVINTINQNKTLTQVAFGLGSTGEENPELWDMCKWLRSINIIPNGTVADISNETAKKIAQYFGACAISYHSDKDVCYDSVKKLTDLGMEQVNMHYVIYKENFNETLQVFDDILNDPRLSKLNAIVLLSLKKKGRAENSNFTQLSQSDFNTLVHLAFKKGIRLGFDSCSAPKFEKAIHGFPNEKALLQLSERCESSCFSLYCNVNGMYYPCSFSEFGEGIDLTNCTDFDNVWMHPRTNCFRNNLLANDRNCPIYEI